jgi:CRISPR-associated protein Cas5h
VRYVTFRYAGKYGHFLRAEANANGVTYPYPPRTALLGLVGAVLGLDKDAPQVGLADARLAVGGVPPTRFWHKTNVRKDPPAPLPWRVKKADKGTSSEQRNFRFSQEWLWRPDYRVWAALADGVHAEFAARLRERRWHYTPSLGLAGMLADLDCVSEGDAERLPAGTHEVVTVAPHAGCDPDTKAAADAKPPLGLISLRMPAAATADRVFTQRGYWHEHRGRACRVTTADAWRCNDDGVVFL